MERLHAYGFGALVLVLTASPALRRPHDDSFPLSTYPMFAHHRGRDNDVTRVVAVAADGSEVSVPPSYVANAETMQAFYTIARAVAAGPRAASALCRGIAQRLRGAADPHLLRAARVAIVTERVDAIDYLAGRAEPSDRRLHARCVGPASEGP